MNRFIILCLLIAVVSAEAQTKFDTFFKPSDSLHVPRRNAVIISEAALASITLIGLNQLWYSDFEQSKFHTINDADEWLQIDKLGHAFSAYQLGRFSGNLMEWSGVSKNKRLIYGGGLSFTFLTAVEVFDGFSAEWGFSWSDMAANTVGVGLYVGQELLWDEQRIMLKYSFHQTRFAQINPDKLGNGFTEELLKDYNGQTYWLSCNLKSFFKNSNIPSWLDVSFGYGGEGMLTGISNSDMQFLETQKRYRQYYLSLDVNLTKIKTKSRFLRSLFDVFSSIKVPMPTMEFNGKSGLKLHGIYF